MRRHRAPACVAVIAALVPCAVALAQDDVTLVRIEYRAEPACPAEGALLDGIRARTSRVRFSPEAKRVLVVRAHGGTRASGALELKEADGSRTQRAVSGATCAEVVDGLALIAALALDPFATSTPTPSPTPTPTPTPTPSPSPPPPPHFTFTAGADAEAVYGVSPDVLLGVPLFVELGRDWSDHFASSVGLRFERTGETSLDATGSGGAFTWTAGALELCPLMVSTGGRRPLQLRPCARLEAGVIDAVGVGVTPVRSASRPWVDLGLALGARWRLVGPLFVEAEGAMLVPLVRDRFFLEPNQTVFQAPWVGLRAGGGLGVAIW